MDRQSLDVNSTVIRGNLRSYRRREFVRPQNRAAQITIVDDVVERPVVVQQEANPIVSVVQSTPKARDDMFIQLEPVTQAKPQLSEEPTVTNIEQPIMVEQISPTQELQTESQPEPSLEELADQILRADELPVLDEHPEGYEYHQDELLAEQMHQINYDEPLIKQRGKFWFLHPKFSLPSLALFLFLIGCAVALQGFRANREVQAATEAHDSQSQTASPEEVADETEPDSNAFQDHNVAADMPRYIRAPKIVLNNRVVSIGTTDDNELKAPGNIYNVGWYDKSSKPGQPGAALVDAHVHGPTKPGAFYNLKLLRTGDEIEVERGDGAKIKYQVAATETVDAAKVDMSKMMRPYKSDKPGLNLITCGGAYNKTTKMYEQRVLVYAVQI